MPDETKDPNETSVFNTATPVSDEPLGDFAPDGEPDGTSAGVYQPDMPEALTTEKTSLPGEIIVAAKLAAEEAEKATKAAEEASRAAKTVFDQDYSQEMISEKIRQARIDLTKQASLAAQAALLAQESAREAAAAAIHRAEEDAATALSEFHEAEKELAKIRSLTEKAEESALEAKDAATLAEKLSETETQKAEACKNALKAAVILVANAEKRYKEAEAVLNQTREDAIEAERNLNSSKQAALAASLEAKALLGKIEEETPSATTLIDDSPPQRSDFRKFMSGLWTTIKLIFIAAMIALLLRTYVFDITKVIGSSMIPTLENGDNLFTSKISYYLEDPQRGDIVIVDAPDKNGEYYIKRIVGLPNEEIMIQNGLVYIDGVLLDENYLADTFPTTGDSHLIIEDGAYFVMGDNRIDSHDSRDESVGTILKDQIHGKAIFRIYPWDSFGKID